MSQQKPRESQVQRIENEYGAALEDKPFTRALILRAADFTDESIEYIEKAGGEIKSISAPETLKEEVATAAVLVSTSITFKAMENLGRSAVYPSNKPIPHDATQVFAFSLFLLAYILEPVNQEGFDISLNDVSLRTILQFIGRHPSAKEELEQIWNNTMSIAKQMSEAVLKQAKGKGPKDVKEWSIGLMMLTKNYVLQRTAKDPAYTDESMIQLISDSLAVGLDAVE